ncbi:3-isopropylmalate dehydratase large subunit [Sphaerobacter thermophilus]|jgi:3-isopropylmalate/(R)-2-methylmalate dehydratase large subunit|uniref:3-isopropylmalate dehydratase large subunit n=1 Tax=Sphaerobacter thermophilus (strain ATCC 49802 / DSM 20745 / KCCM 41009 / NCIMB 13125 / S 6022) TaxID=479434 RepID=D1C1T4_SPHTD|nr:3-isopropylmalate dehydratase large subunit [Sphaerobacter thermophilus]ACZ38201.1 homoaconitate hydratase family protein [Sphaerobacter thermophilus DSM 20745]PZN66991.1 MAG: 3-isopropylmalate dehydratase large subunit [Sphaerobacter thermophilus]
MGQTMTEKILSRAAGRRVEPGEIAEVAVDLVMTNDITAPLAIKEFKKTGLEKVFDPNKVVFVPDHFVPAKDIKAAEQAKVMREFAVEQGAVYFEVGRAGIEHVVLPENGLTLPGQVIIGGDSHTCTYGAFNAFATGMGSTDIAAAMALGTTWVRVPPTIKFVYNGTLPEGVGGKDLILYTIGQIGVDGALYAVMEFTGEVIDALDMDGRIAMANMAIEAGAKTGIFACDDKTREWLARVTDRPYEPVESDPDAEYLKVIEFDVSNLKPVVALPHLPSNVYPADEVGDMPIHQVVIGSCTNGRISDLREVAKILKGRQVHPNVRCIVIPGSQEVAKQATREGLADIFLEAGAIFSTSTCGPCLGGYMGVLAKGERCVSTTNRNFRGRMGHREAEIILAGPQVAAASAVLGRVASPAALN